MVAGTISIIQGEDFTLQLAFKNPNASPYNLTGATVKLVVRKNAASTPVISKSISSIPSPTAGIVLVPLSGADTDLAIRAWQYQITLVDSLGADHPSGVNQFLVTNQGTSTTTTDITIVSNDVTIEMSLVGAQGPAGPTGATGATGTTGATGPAGPGVASAGSAAQVLTKNSGTNYDTSWQNPAVQSVAGRTGAIVVTKSDVGLGSADNTSDANKPVSTAQAAANALRVAKSGDSMSGALQMRAVTGTPPTPPIGRSGAVDTGLDLLSSFDGGEDSGAGGTFDSTGRLNLYSYQRADVGSFGENIRRFLMKANAKSMDAWYLPKDLYDGNNDPITTHGWTPIAWTGAHYKPNNAGNLHAHWELEIPDANLQLQGRLLVPFADDNPGSGTYGQLGVAKTNIRTNLADFSVDSASGVLRVGGSSGVNDRTLEFSNDVLYGSAGAVRWRIVANNTSESGSNLGSDLAIRRFADDGSLAGTPIFIQRSTGNIALGQGNAETARIASIFDNTKHGFYAKPSVALTSFTAFASLLTASTDRNMEIKVAADTAARFLMDGNGSLNWGDGTNTRDTNLYRSAASTLKTDTALIVGTTLQTPSVVDSSGNSVLTFSKVSSAVNGVSITNAATGNDPLIGASGSDSNISLTLKAVGTGVIKLKDGNGSSILQALMSNSAVNYLQIRNAPTGSAVSIISAGTDSNVSINLIPQGTGTLQLNGIAVPTISSTSVLTNKDLTSGTNTFPTLNQSTTGTAAGLSSTLAIGSGGTGNTTYTDGQLLVGNTTGNTLTKSTLTAGTGISITNGHGSITLATAPVKTGIAKISAGTKQWGIPTTVLFAQGTSALNVNEVRYVPIFVQYPVTLTAWQLEVTTGPGSNANLAVGLYAADTNMQPTGTVLYDSGSVAVASGFTGIKTASSLSIALSPGAYLVAINCDTSMTIRTIIGPTPIVNASMGATAMIQRVSATQTFGALPSTGTLWMSTNATAGGLQHSIAWQWTE